MCILIEVVMVQKMAFGDAWKIDNTIKMVDTDEVFRKRVSRKKRLRGLSSFVVPEVNDEY